MKAKVLFAVLTVMIFLFFSFSKIGYAANNDVFWFVLISDPHVGAEDRIPTQKCQDCSENFKWIVNDAYQTIDPRFIVNAGDLTDQHPFLFSGVTPTLEEVQDIQQWEDYNQILYDANMDLVINNVSIYIDIPGNHDIYHESAPLNNYQDYSIQKITIDANQRVWHYDKNFFMAINTTHPDMTIPIEDFDNKCPGDLNEVELIFIGKELESFGNADLSLSFIFGHHALGREGEDDWGRIIEGRTEFIQLLNQYDVSFYGYGHTHDNHYTSPYFLNSETLVYNVKSIGEDAKYAVIAVDDNKISATEAGVEEWPVVLITYPPDKKLGGDNPFAEAILPDESNFIRALVFDNDIISEVNYRVDNGDWLPMLEIDDNLWEAELDICGLDSGDYLIEVKAKNVLDEITAEIEAIFGIDVVLVIDTSGSMDSWFGPSLLDEAKDAAKSFVGLANINDKIGIVEFNTYAYNVYSLTRIKQDNEEVIKTEVQDAIDDLYASGGTYIGDGLYTAQYQLETYGKCDPVWAMILLSDGQDTSQETKDAISYIAQKKTKVYVIGLGDEADESTLNQIALATGGFYRYAASRNDLKNIYQDIQNAMGGLQAIASYTDNIIQGGIKKFKIEIDNIIKAIFQATIEGSDIALNLIDPNGNIIDPNTALADNNINYTSMEAYKEYAIISPQAGEWQMIITGTDVEPGGEKIRASVSASTELTLDIEFDKTEYIPEEEIKIIAEIQDASGPILNAIVKANVETPIAEYDLILSDSSDDGIYTGIFSETSEKGNYTFKVDASGDSNTGNAFTRTTTKSTVVGQDTDNDGMTDVWEDIYGLDKNVNDASGDADQDGLLNLEEYNYKTNPNNSDTDGDGHNDIDEIGLSDPLNADSIPILITAVIEDFSIYLDENGTAEITAEEAIDSFNAIYGVDSISISKSNFSCSDVGNNNVSITIIDTRGNVLTSYLVITIIDNISPVPDIADLPEITEETEITLTPPTAIDNCAGNITGTTDNLVLGVGNYNIVWTYSDSYNTITQTQSVVVSEPEIVEPEVVEDTTEDIVEIIEDSNNVVIAVEDETDDVYSDANQEIILDDPTDDVDIVDDIIEKITDEGNGSNKKCFINIL